jgi:primosomal protein N' (replication factor Y)
VRAPLHNAARVGLVLSVRDAGEAAPTTRLKSLGAVVDATPVVTSAQIDLLRWISAQSLSSLGSTAAGLLPPPAPSARGPAAPDPPPPQAPRTEGESPELHLGAGRERRILAMAAEARATLILVSDVDAAARWTQRLAKLGRVARLDSGVADAERARGFTELATGRVHLAVGTRSAWLGPLPPGGTLALIEEEEAAHKPPGHPRMHARDVALERGRRESLRVAVTAGAPSVEMWWRATSGRATLVAGERAPWPTVTVADTRGILRREPLTPEVSRALREALAASGRAFIAVSRLASALACDECGTVVRCDRCAVAFAYSRAAAQLGCRVCGNTSPLPDTCAHCHGRRLSPFGWGVERVEHAVRRRFPEARVARYEPDTRGKRAQAQRAAAAEADVVIGTRGALRMFGPGALTLAAFVSPDQQLRLPDFRAGERMVAFLWAAAERTRAGGQVVIQSQNPEHHAFAAVAHQDLERFYAPELKFRAELGYPPFRRVAIVTVPADGVDGHTPPDLARALGAASRLTVYPPLAGRNRKVVRIVVKGGDDLAAALSEAIVGVSGGKAASRGIMDVEVDPVEWPS